MPSRDLSFPVFDADNHMYETPDAFTKYVPKEYEGIIKYVEVERPHQDRRPEQDQVRTSSQTPPSRSWPSPGPKRSTSRSAIPTASPAGRSWARASKPQPPSSEPEPRLALLERAGHRPGR